MKRTQNFAPSSTRFGTLGLVYMLWALALAAMICQAAGAAVAY